MSATKRKATQTSAFIMSVGALINAVVMLIGYLLELPGEFYPLAAAVVGAALAVWRTGVGLPMPKNRRGYARIDVLAHLLLGLVAIAAFVAVLSLVTGCNQTVVKDNPGLVNFDLNRKTCAMWIDVDGKRAFEVNPGPATKCGVKVTP